MTKREIPEPDYEDPKEVYAFFGLAFYMAQVLEQGVANLAVALHAKGVSPVTAGDIKILYERFDKQTFGQVLRAAQKVVFIDGDLVTDLEQALIKRNYLAHAFFVEHDANHMSQKGRVLMINELTQLISLFSDVDERFNRVWMEAWKALGVTEEWWQEQVKKRKADIANEA